MDYDAREPVLCVQRMARRIAEVFGLDVGPIVVCFHDNVDFAGRVELSASCDFFVEVHAEFRAQPRVIAAVLCHEVAHIFLYRGRLALPETQPNEIRTDTTAALYGFGALMADTFVFSEKREDLVDSVRITRMECALGYLTPDELGYVLTRSGFARVDDYLRSAAVRGALQQGGARAVLELASRARPGGACCSTASGARGPISAVCARSWPPHTPCTFHDGHISLPLRQKLIARCASCELEVACIT